MQGAQLLPPLESRAIGPWTLNLLRLRTSCSRPHEPPLEPMGDVVLRESGRAGR